MIEWLKRWWAIRRIKRLIKRRAPFHGIVDGAEFERAISDQMRSRRVSK